MGRVAAADEGGMVILLPTKGELIERDRLDFEVSQCISLKEMALIWCAALALALVLTVVCAA